jgi:hypothetical protein
VHCHTMTPDVKATLLHGSPSSVLQSPHTSELPPIDGILSDWVCPASQKSLRTTNPIRAIVDPIVACSSLKSGEERGDGKDHISLAVRSSEENWRKFQNVGNNNKKSHSVAQLSHTFFVFLNSVVGRSHGQWTPSDMSGCH